jgi:hypothetical protein
MKRLTALASVGVMAVSALQAGTGPAQAKAPGPNGRIVNQMPPRYSLTVLGTLGGAFSHTVFA